MKRLRRPPGVDVGVAAPVVPAVLRVDLLPVARQVRRAPPRLRLRLLRPAEAFPVRQAPRVRQVVLAVAKGVDRVARRLRRPSPRRSIK